MSDKTDKAAEETAAEEAAAAGETIPGGKYLAADGKTFVDANGKSLGKASDESDDLSSHTVAELKEIADDEGVDLTGITLKDDIIAAIEEKRG